MARAPRSKAEEAETKPAPEAPSETPAKPETEHPLGIVVVTH